jgi:hypothetical protein
MKFATPSFGLLAIFRAVFKNCGEHTREWNEAGRKLKYEIYPLFPQAYLDRMSASTFRPAS